MALTPSACGAVCAISLTTNEEKAETGNTFPAVKLPADHDTCPLVLTTPEVSRAFKRVNAWKAPGLNGIHGHVLRACAVQLADVFTNIFNLSLRLTVIPTCFKQTTIIPVAKKTTVSCLNDYRPVALTSVIMKCFERLVKSHICSSLPDSLDPFQFAYGTNRSTDDVIAMAIHSALKQLEGRDTCVQMLFIDYSSVFNTTTTSG